MCDNSLSDHDHDTIYSLSRRKYFSLSNNILLAIKSFQSRYCKKYSWKITLSQVVTMTKYIFCHVTHILRAYENLPHLLIILQLCLANYLSVNWKWQNIFICHVRYVPRNKWCIPYVTTVTTKFLLIIKFSQTVTIHIILKYLYLSSG